ncbi:MAG TPA: hypothetical protein VM144_10170 [Aestuariivirga sp.]|nr:hypothetical protein [Aestuariivirga sp.]
MSKAPFAATTERGLSALNWLSNYGEDDVNFILAGAVWRHLRAIWLIKSAKLADAEADVNAASALWTRVYDLINGEKAGLTKRSLAFHARLSSRNSTAFETFERKRLLQLVEAARLKTNMLLAVIAFRSGDKLKAAESVWAIAELWRDKVPIRLPGLAEIEKTGAQFFAQMGSIEKSKILTEKAYSLSGALASYPNEMFVHWPEGLSRENVLRFGFAACILPTEILETK